MGNKQPTATAFTRTQESWAQFVLKKIRKDIQEKEDYLINERGWSRDQLSEDDALLDLYDDEIFYERHARYMADQRDYLREKYFNE